MSLTSYRAAPPPRCEEGSACSIAESMLVFFQGFPIFNDVFAGPQRIEDDELSGLA